MMGCWANGLASAARSPSVARHLSGLRSWPGQEWNLVTEATEKDPERRSKIISKLLAVAQTYNDHPPIETINELLRQCAASHGNEMDNIHKLTEIISQSGVRPDSSTYQALMASYTYFPRPGSDAPG